jgi:hypothetical protein
MTTEHSFSPANKRYVSESVNNESRLEREKKKTHVGLSLRILLVRRCGVLPVLVSSLVAVVVAFVGEDSAVLVPDPAVAAVEDEGAPN